MVLRLNENYSFRECCILAWFGNVAQEGRGEGREGEGSGQFPEGSWEVLQDIILHGDGGRHLEPVVTRDVSKNYEKEQVWNKITTSFNEVSFFYLFITQQTQNM